MPDGTYFDRALELTPWAELQRAAFEKARAQLERVYATSSFYRRKYDAAGVNPEKVQDPSDFAAIPFFTKEDERRAQEEAPPLGEYVCVERDQVARVYASSGTTGRPTFLPLTARDLATWRRIMARTFYTAGVRQSDTAAVLANLALFVGGIPSVDAYTEIGAASVPIGATLGTIRTLELLDQLGVTVVALTPSFAVHLAELVRTDFGSTPSELGLRLMLVGGEPGGQIPAVRRQIQDDWGCLVRDAMGIGEFGGAMWAESDDESGMHFCAQAEIYLELIDPDSGELIPLEDGAVGELVYTSAEREAAPLIRFRSRDHVRVRMEPTPSGRTAPRITTLGRTDDMLIVRGINVFPSAVRDVVAGFVPDTTGHIQIVLPRVGPLAEAPLRIDIELDDRITGIARAELCGRVSRALRDRLNFTSHVRAVGQGTLPRTALKTQYIRIEE